MGFQNTWKISLKIIDHIMCLVIALNNYSNDNKQNLLTWFYLLFLRPGSSSISVGLQRAQDASISVFFLTSDFLPSSNIPRDALFFLSHSSPSCPANASLVCQELECFLECFRNNIQAFFSKH